MHTRQIKKGEKTIARIRAPISLINSVWDIALSKSTTGWMCHFRTYNVVPYESKVMDMAYRGNIKGLQKLFDSGHASPFDLCDDGVSMLGVSCLSAILHE